MDKSIQDNLCKGIRACGIPRKESHQLLNEFEKWYRESGAEWTNSRIKDLRQWYESYLTGDPKPPKWFKHSKEGLPLGIWKWVFKLPPAKALGVLSMNTVLYEHKLSETQKEKFLHGLAGNDSRDPDKLRSYFPSHPVAKKWAEFSRMPDIKFPTIFDMNGSCPIHDGHSSIRPEQNLGLGLEALRLSWEDVPQVTFDFLDSQNLLTYMPVDVVGNDYQLELDRPHSRNVGRVSVIQQPQLKARIVGNPNRVLQVTLEPLKQIFMDTAKRLPTDVTHDQQSGVRWVQNKLRQGFTLAGSDLTSASDLLDVDLCFELVNRVFGFPDIPGYSEYEKYFKEVSRSSWWCPALGTTVQWEQGDVLGTGPSFGLLTLTNNASALLAWRKDVLEHPEFWRSPAGQHLSRQGVFRVVGDDIVMVERIAQNYDDIISSLGGEINHTKTLTSNRVAEFAGRVITCESSYLKAIKYSEPSDNSFMSYMAQLGDQAKYLLKPKQRQAYNLFKEVPGIVVEGPWMQDSYGVPFSERYQWYLEEVQPALQRVNPDLTLSDYSMELLKAQLELEGSKANSVESIKEKQLDEPLIDEGYLPSLVDPHFKVGGDPRLVDGLTQVQVLNAHVLLKDITPFDEWKRQKSETITNREVSAETLPSEKAPEPPSEIDLLKQRVSEAQAEMLNASTLDEKMTAARRLASAENHLKRVALGEEKHHRARNRSSRGRR